MAKDFSRLDRIGDMLKRELSILIQHEINDPRVGMVSVTEVKVSRDLMHAKIYVSVLQPDEKIPAPIRPLSKLATEKQKQGTSEQRNGVYTPVHEDANTEATQHLPSAVEFQERSIEALNHAAGYLRYQLAQRVELRVMPELRFYYDDSLVRGNRIASLIDNVTRDKSEDVE